MRITDWRDGLPVARGRGGYAALQPFHYGNLAQAPQCVGLQNQLCIGPGKGDHLGACVNHSIERLWNRYFRLFCSVMQGCVSASSSFFDEVCNWVASLWRKSSAFLVPVGLLASQGGAAAQFMLQLQIYT